MTYQHPDTESTAHSLAPTRDHVAQVYLGLLDGGAAGDRLRRRIDWMADQARGPRVLDVGCGEGILPLLLARRGITVTGVDVDPDALDFARKLLAREPDEVRGRVELVQWDFLQTPPAAGLFDTVLMGEMLDCVEDPGAMLDRGVEHLGPGGRIVVTAPFGADPREPERRTFSLMDMIDLLKPRLGLDMLTVEDDHIRFVGRVSEGHESSWRRLDAGAVLAMTNTALADSRAALSEMLAKRDSRIERLQQRLRQRVEAERATQRRVNASNERVKGIEIRNRLDRIELAQVKKDLGASHKRAQELRARIQTLNKNLAARAGEVRVLRHRLQAARTSTSFLVGSELVRAAKQPLTMWKLPFRLLRIYRSRSTPPPPEKVAATDSGASRQSVVPGDPRAVSDGSYFDPSRLINFPPLPVPEAGSKGPPVAAILDTFTEHALRHEVDLVLMSPEHWRDQMERTRPVCLFVESAWRGNNGGWQDRIVGYENLDDNPLRELVEYCRSAGIPTVFWNKEDPPHFDNFLGAAKEFDFVFTSDSDCVPLYREALGHDRIYVLPFAAQPRVHNPSRERDWPRYPVCFAGSWVSRRYPERAEALRSLLDGAMPHGLHIFDRNLTRPEFGLDYRFPDEYREAVRGTLTYDEMLTAYRCYDVMLNVNTITESPTMFARRVFESLACGTPVVSQDSVGMRRMLGGHVRVTRSAEETSGHVEDLLADEEARIREGHLAYRHVHENHTYRHRVDEVFRRVGLEPLGTDKPPVSVLMPTMRPGNVAQCLENFTKQTYENKELVLILNNAEFDLDAIRKQAESVPNVRVLHVEGRTTLGSCLNLGVEASSGKYVAKMDDDDLYGEKYLSDSVLAASFSGAEVVGKGLYFVYFEAAAATASFGGRDPRPAGGSSEHLEATDTTAIRENTPEHTFTSSALTGGTLFIRTEVAREVSFGALSLKEDTNFQRAAERSGCRIYSADRFNFVRVRMRQLTSHSDQTPDAEFLKKCRDHTPGLDLDRVMI